MERDYIRKLSEPPPYYESTTISVQQQPDFRITPQYQNSNQPQQFYPSAPLIGNLPYANPYQTTGIVTQQSVAVNIKQVPSSYSAAAWLTCLFCCCPLGLLSVIYSNEVTTAILLGDMTRAQVASQSARNFAIAALTSGIVIIITTIILVVGI
ncbi:proline rich transmembrane protein 1B isoform X1 [Hydra vulgaris]|uniref:proline rich transmembrane protein 1B isoform X1 n=1 Tax=Hydra vulgaris TaxID=6087 RepID=UPI00019252AE|nr:proline rich transmembrane protein 1B [Hydra vulgaris]XP_047138301.1 proline rich transmembrane protein 1B [Hydra vulgaris]